MERFISITEIGKHYGVASRVAGRWLKRLGLRGEDGEPTDMALQEGYCKSIYLEDRGVSFWVWNARRTLDLIEESLYNGGFAEVDEGDVIDQKQ
jgi:hypothetical protein